MWLLLIGIPDRRNPTVVASARVREKRQRGQHAFKLDERMRVSNDKQAEKFGDYITIGIHACLRSEKKNRKHLTISRR